MLINDKITLKENNEAEDFVRIESTNGLLCLVSLVINEGRFDLLEQFIKNTLDRKLSLIVCASVLNLSFLTNFLENRIKQVLSMLKPNHKESMIVYLLTKQYINPNILSRYLSPDNLDYIMKHSHKDISLYQYFHENKTVYRNPNKGTIYMGKIVLDRDIHSLINYKDHIKKLIFKYTPYKNEQKFEQKMINKIQEDNPESNFIRKILKYYNVRIEGLLLAELYPFMKQHPCREVFTMFSCLAAILSRKYDILNENILKNFDINSLNENIKYCYFEAVKYFNLELVGKLLRIKLKEGQTIGYSRLTNSVSSSDLKYISYVRDKKHYINSIIDKYSNLLNMYTFNYYYKEIKSLCSMLEDYVDNTASNVYLQYILLNATTELKMIETHNIDLTDSFIQHVVEKNYGEELNLDVLPKPGTPFDTICIATQDDRKKCKSFTHYTSKGTINFKQTCNGVSTESFEDIRKDKKKMTLLYKEIYKFYEKTKTFDTQYFEYPELNAMSELIDYAIRNSTFFLLEGLKKEVEWLIASPKCIKSCKNLEKLYEIAGEEGAIILETISNMTEGPDFEIFL